MQFFGSNLGNEGNHIKAKSFCILKRCFLPPRSAWVSKRRAEIVADPCCEASENFVAVSAPVSFFFWVRKRQCDQHTLKNKTTLFVLKANTTVESSHLETVVSLTVILNVFCKFLWWPSPVAILAKGPDSKGPQTLKVPLKLNSEWMHSLTPDLQDLFFSYTIVRIDTFVANHLGGINHYIKKNKEGKSKKADICTVERWWLLSPPLRKEN